MLSPGVSSSKTRLIDIALVLSTAFCIGMSIGLYPPLLAINVDVQGFDPRWNGLLGAMAPLAGFVISAAIPGTIARIGQLNTFILGAAFSSIAGCLFPFFSDLWIWFLLRFVMGIGMGFQWVSGEAWLNRLASGPRRGIILGIYVIVLSAGITVGPIIMQLAGTSGIAPFLAGGALLAISSLPMLLVAPAIDSGHVEKTVPLLKAFMRRPSTMLASAADGFTFVALMAFLPLYLMRLGIDERGALTDLTICFSGSMVFLLIVGWLLDHFRVEGVLAACCGLFGMSLLALPVFIGSPFLVGFLMLAIGASSGAFYAAGLAGVNDAFLPEEMASGTTVFSMLWYIGGLLGPVAAGYGMSLWAPHGVLISMIAASGLLGIVNIAALLHAPPQSALAQRAMTEANSKSDSR